MISLTESCFWLVLGILCTVIPTFALSRPRSRALSGSQHTHHFPTTMTSIPKVPAFRALRLTPTSSTFLVVEHSDVYDEHPHIYVKFLDDSTLLIVDTGCGGKTDNPDVTLTSLREFIETVDVDDNGGKPLNQDGKRGYIVVLSHCHYDHICTSRCVASQLLFAPGG